MDLLNADELLNMFRDGWMPCQKEECPTYDRCLHDGEDCIVHKAQMLHVQGSIRGLYAAGRLTDHGVHVAMTVILPLYSDIFKLNFEKRKLVNPIVYSKVVYVHPVYKESLAIARVITDMWKTLGVVKDDQPIPGAITAENGKSSSYYTMIADDKSGVEQVEEASVQPRELSVSRPVERTLSAPSGSVFEAIDALTEELEQNAELAKMLECGDDDIVVPAAYMPSELPDVPEDEEGR